MALDPGIIRRREEKLDELTAHGKETTVAAGAQSRGLSYRDLTHAPVHRGGLPLIDRSDAERARAVVLERREHQLVVGVVDERNEETLQILNQLRGQGFSVELVIISEASFQKVLKEYARLPEIHAQKTPEGKVVLPDYTATAAAQSLATLRGRLLKLRSGETSELLEILAAGALSLNASDIHVEPQERAATVRLRLDGLLQDVGTLSGEHYRLLLSRIKILSGIQLNITDVGQDGRFTIESGKYQIEVRVSMLPGAYGEYVVLRILNPHAVALEVDDLGIEQDLWEKVEHELKKPNGMLLTTGPTGSGKTTTLYAFLKYLRSPEVKIITLENPIEYHLEGISQSQIEPSKKYTFADALRSVLRHDPDIVLVGEIRDAETAGTALNASLTGHFVFSTLHTNDAPGAVPRLIDLEATPAVLGSALNTVIAQRLVRRLCPSCRQATSLPPNLRAQAEAAFKDDPELRKMPADTKQIFTAKGCALCGETGYRGRTGIFEVFVVDETMERLIASSPTHLEVFETAKRSGFRTMYHNGLRKILAGLTTEAELVRVAEARF
jgi:type II secretory ATPase GspE/PulE/Tfp pilus assembly ATPase PilB-like protein